MAHQKILKKRAAPSGSRSGSVAKKCRTKDFDALPEKESTIQQKRSRPVTLPARLDGDVSDSEDEERDESEVGENISEDEGDVHVPPHPTNAARESHRAQKALYEQRRAAKPHANLITEAKRVWALACQKNLPAAERKVHITSLMQLIRGKVTEIAFKHDVSRILQTIVKHGERKDREEVAIELRGKYRELAQRKYSKFIVSKLIKLCPSHRRSILLELQPHVPRLVLHREASHVLADAFDLYANAYERSLLLRPFYGKEATLFSFTVGSEQDRERAKKGLRGIMDVADERRRRRVLNVVKENLITVFSNPEKGTATLAIVHRVLLEYLLALNDLTNEEEQEKYRREMFDSCQEIFAEMVHTKDGSRAVREFIAQGTSKDRKQIVKVLKSHVERMCLDDEAQLVLFTALDVIDDTKLTAKTIVSDITSHAQALSETPQGRRALFYLMSPRDQRHFTPAQVACLAETDAIRARTSKKDMQVRAQEVRKAASQELIAFLERTGPSLARDTSGSLLVLEIMLHAEGDKTTATEALLQALAESYPSTDESKPHPIDLPHTSRMYKSLLQGGHFSRKMNAVVRSLSFSPAMFASAFIKIVGRETTLAIARGNGAFLVTELCERLREEASVEERKEVRSWFSENEMDGIKDGKSKGTDILLEKIRALC